MNEVGVGRVEKGRRMEEGGKKKRGSVESA